MNLNSSQLDIILGTAPVRVCALLGQVNVLRICYGSIDYRPAVTNATGL